MRRSYFSVVALILLAFGFVVCVAPPPTVSQEVKDPPLISRYPGSTSNYLYPSSVKELDEIWLPMGLVAPNGAEEGVWQ